MDSAKGPSPSSLEASYSGIVTPAHYRIPTWDFTLGERVANLNEAVGFAPDPEQRLLLDIAFARQFVPERMQPGINYRNGVKLADAMAASRSAVFECACICCRQNLKTGFFKQLELGWLFITDERLVVHSAHEFNTSRETFRDLKDIIEASPMLCKRIPLNGIRTGNGDQSIETTTGARLVFKTRTKSGGRGLSGRKIVLDEAFALQADHMGALLPLVSAQPDPQIFYGSSAAKAESVVLHGLVKRLRGDQDDPRFAALEWCAPPPKIACDRAEDCDHRIETPGCGLDKREYIRLANPQAGKRIAWDTIDGERKALAATPEEHGRERAGWHDEPAAGKPAIDLDEWSGLRERDTALVGGVALAFDVRPGATAAAIVSVGRLAGTDHWRGEITGKPDERGEHVLDARTGTHWLVPRLVEIALHNDVSVVVMDSAGPAGAFEVELLNYRLDPADPDSTVFVKLGEDEPVPDGKVRLLVVTSREYAQACGALDNDIRNRRWRHFGQLPLNEAVEGARTMPSGDAWKWSRKDSSVNIAPLVAATLARHGFALFGAKAAELSPFMLVGR